jgi:hypothetical protein
MITVGHNETRTRFTPMIKIFRHCDHTIVKMLIVVPNVAYIGARAICALTSLRC